MNNLEPIRKIVVIILVDILVNWVLVSIVYYCHTNLIELDVYIIGGFCNSVMNYLYNQVGNNHMVRRSIPKHLEEELMKLV